MKPTTDTTKRRVIYGVDRALEHCLSMPDVQPQRFFATLFPLWQVEISAKVYDSEPYDVLDKFIERAIEDGGIDSADGLAEFYGLERSLVDRVLYFLATIGHITKNGHTVTLTEFGRQSLRQDKRQVWKESRQKLLFDGFTSSPLPRKHYSDAVKLVRSSELPREKTLDRSQFQALAGDVTGPTEGFNANAVQRLSELPDRDQYNLPHGLHEVEILNFDQVYLPVYLIEVVSAGSEKTGYLAFSEVDGERDSFVESLANGNPLIRRMLDAEDMPDPEARLGRWLEKHGYRADALCRQPNGVWRATLPAADFGDNGEKFRFTKLGSFQVDGRHFLQLWCDSAEIRRRTVRERGLRLLNLRELTREALLNRLRSLSRQLEVSLVDLDELRSHAVLTNRPDRVKRIDELE